MIPVAVRALILVAAAAASLPLVALTVEGLLSRAENIVLPAHWMLMAALGAAMAAGRARSRARLVAGAVAGAAAALVAEVGWLLAIAG